MYSNFLTVSRKILRDMFISRECSVSRKSFKSSFLLKVQIRFNLCSALCYRPWSSPEQINKNSCLTNRIRLTIMCLQWQQQTNSVQMLSLKALVKFYFLLLPTLRSKCQLHDVMAFRLAPILTTLFPPNSVCHWVAESSHICHDISKRGGWCWGRWREPSPGTCTLHAVLCHNDRAGEGFWPVWDGSMTLEGWKLTLCCCCVSNKVL